MTSIDVPFALPWLAFALTWLALGAVAVLVHLLLRRPAARLQAQQRGALLLALALLPFGGAALVAFLGFAPEIGGLAVNAHCHADTGCGPHVPTLQASIAQAVLVGGLLLLASASAVWRLTGRLRRSLALAGALQGFATPARRESFAVVESAEVFAYCVGLLRPRLVVSRGLLTRLPSRQREAVLTHERAHAGRLDNLRQWLAGISLWPLPRRWRASLLRELALANEQSCDAVAAARAGAADVAAALGALGARDEQMVQRLAAIAAPPPAIPPTGLLAAIVALYTACTLPMLDAVHFGLELFSRWLK